YRLLVYSSRGIPDAAFSHARNAPYTDEHHHDPGGPRRGAHQATDSKDGHQRRRDRRPAPGPAPARAGADPGRAGGAPRHRPADRLRLRAGGAPSARPAHRPAHRDPGRQRRRAARPDPDPGRRPPGSAPPGPPPTGHRPPPPPRPAGPLPHHRRLPQERRRRLRRDRIPIAGPESGRHGACDSMGGVREERTRQSAASRWAGLNRRIAGKERRQDKTSLHVLRKSSSIRLITRSGLFLLTSSTWQALSATLRGLPLTELQASTRARRAA